MITYNSASSEARAKDLSTRIAALENGSAAASIRADIGLPESPALIVEATLAAFSTPTIDILVNNAGSGAPGKTSNYVPLHLMRITVTRPNS